MTAVEPWEPPQPKEFVYTIEEDFLKLQKAGKCGELQENGKRCQSPVLEWLVLDPDKPATEVNRIGACGTHVRQVGPRLKDLQRNVYDRRIRDYTLDEGRRIIRSLKLLGFKLVTTDNYGKLTTRFENPAEFLYTLGELGILDKLGVDIEAPRCQSIGKRYGSDRQCMEADGHLERGIRHNDWGDFFWDEPKPEPEPEPKPEPKPELPSGFVPVEVKTSEGGQFS